MVDLGGNIALLYFTLDSPQMPEASHSNLNRLPKVLIASLAALFLLSLPLYFKPPGVHDYLVMRELNQTGHVILFTIAQFIFLWIVFTLKPNRFDRLWKAISTVMILAILAFFIGVFIEYIQPYFNRGRQWSDIMRNVLGISAGSGLFWLWQKSLTELKILALLVSILALSAGFYHVTTAAISQYLLAKSFPLLNDMENPLMDQLLRPYYKTSVVIKETPPGLTKEITRAALIHFPKKPKWNGLVIELPPRNLEKYTSLSLNVYSQETSETRLGIRLKYYGRVQEGTYDTKCKVKPGINLCVLNLESNRQELRKLKSREVVFYSPEDDRDYALWIDNITFHESEQQ